MKKKLVAGFICLLVVGFKLSAEKPKFLLQADIHNVFAYWEIGENNEFHFYPQIWPLPFITGTFQIPLKSSARMYVGLKTMPYLAVNCLEAYCSAGYAFEKPEHWDKYHVEILGEFGVGGELIFIEFFQAAAVCDLGVSVFLMPEDKGFFAGIGTNCFMQFDVLSSYFDLSSLFPIKLSAGWKF